MYLCMCAVKERERRERLEVRDETRRDETRRDEKGDLCVFVCVCL